MQKIIFLLAKVAKLNWGLSHKALQTIYVEGIQPLLIYGLKPFENKTTKQY
jgi:hypothetical protein